MGQQCHQSSTNDMIVKMNVKSESVQAYWLGQPCLRARLQKKKGLL